MAQRYSHHPLLLSIASAAGLVLAASAATFAAPPPDKPGHEMHGKGQGEQHKKAHHQNGKQLLGEKVKTNGHHTIDQKGNVTASVEVKDGKVAGLHAKHAQKGDLPVKKYKSSQKLAQADESSGPARMIAVQEYIGTTYIGYAYYDDYGDEEIYWFPYDMILDGDTGAIDYVPAAA
ncbi:MAG: hypothetical protein E6K53_15405 [Gammaproteobacteria bacterium]|nr:MAG: hypothetical protein E6K53_15405 [Gammaproteobacteria bacterium]